MADGLRDASFGTTIIALSLEEAKSKIENEDIDVAVLSDALGCGVFQLIRDVRHNRVGRNPFMCMLCALAPEHTQPTEQDINLISKLGEKIGTAAKTGVADPDIDAAEEERDLSCPDLDEPALEIQFVNKGSTLFKDGDPAIAAYIVAVGWVGIFRKVGGKNAPVARIRKGEFFGEMAILDGSPRRATAVALEDTTLSLVSKESLEEKMEACDELIRTILLTAILNLRTAHEDYTQKARSLQDMLKTMSLSRHIVGRFIERLGIKKEDESVDGLFKQFDAKFAEIVTLCAPVVAADRRTDQVLDENEMDKAKEE